MPVGSLHSQDYGNDRDCARTVIHHFQFGIMVETLPIYLYFWLGIKIPSTAYYMVIYDI